MDELLRLFHSCEGDFEFVETDFHEDDFQTFLFKRDCEHFLQRAHRTEIDRLVNAIKSPISDQTPSESLAQILHTSLEHAVYDKFIEEIAGASALGLFLEDSLVDPNEQPRFDETKERHFRKYRAFRFGSFLDLLRPGSIRWRRKLDWKTQRVLSKGLERFLGADIHERGTILKRWVQGRRPGVFSDKITRRAQLAKDRRACILRMGNLGPQGVAKNLDSKFSPPTQKYASYLEWFLANRRSFGSWLSREQKIARRGPLNRHPSSRGPVD